MVVYDVIIVGAGMAGLSTAKRLSQEKNLKVLLVEKEKKFTGPHLLMTFNDIVEDYELHDAIVSKFPSYNYYSKNVKTNLPITKKHFSYYIDLDKFAKSYRKKIKCQVKCNTEIVDAKYGKNKITLVDNMDKKYVGKIVIDCSGNTSVVADSLGIERSRVYCKVLSYTIKGKNIPKSNWMVPLLYMDHHITRCAGAWAVQYENNKVHIGISSLNPYYESTKGDLQRRLDLFLLKVHGYNKYFKDHKVVGKKVYKISPVLQAIDPMVKDNLLVVGDAAGQATAFFGMGSDPCFKMGEAAAEVAIDAIKNKNYSKKFLMKYEKIWWQKFGKYELKNILLRDACARFFEDEDWDQLVIALRKLSGYEFYKALRCEYDFKLIAKIFPPKIFFHILHRIIRAKLLALVHPKISFRHLSSKVL